MDFARQNETGLFETENMDAFLGINTGIPDLTEFLKIGESTEEQVTKTLYTETTTVQIQKSNAQSLEDTNDSVKESKSDPLRRRMQSNDSGFYDEDAIVSKSNPDSTRSALKGNAEKQSHPRPVHQEDRSIQGISTPRTVGKREDDHEAEGGLPAPIFKTQTPSKRNPPITKERRKRRTKAFVLSRMGCSPDDWEPWSMTVREFQPLIEGHIKDLDKALKELLAHEECTGTNCGHWFRKEARQEKLAVIKAGDRRRELFADEWYGTLEEAMTKTHRAIPFDLRKNVSDVRTEEDWRGGRKEESPRMAYMIPKVK